MTEPSRFEWRDGDIVWDEPDGQPETASRAGPPDEPRDERGRWTSEGAAIGDAAAEAVRTVGGFTIDPKHATAATSGFAVAIKGHAATMPGDRFLSDRTARTAFVKQWLRENRDVLSQPGSHIGGWIDTDTQLVYFDVSEVLSDRSAAIQAGCDRGEIAIYDLSSADEIRLDC